MDDGLFLVLMIFGAAILFLCVPFRAEPEEPAERFSERETEEHRRICTQAVLDSIGDNLTKLQKSDKPIITQRGHFIKVNEVQYFWQPIPGTYEDKEYTNCKNCGAPKYGKRCEYCQTETK